MIASQFTSDDRIKKHFSHCLGIFSNHPLESEEQRKAQLQLNQYYNRTLASPENYKSAPDDLEEFIQVKILENAWNVHEEDKIKNTPIPDHCNEFAQWYEEVSLQHKIKVRDFFNYLAEEASLEELAYYICLEEKVDGSFDDIIALAQLGTKSRMKLVMAENYWDEMGHGKEEEMHTIMFATSANFMKKLIKNTGILNDECPVAGLKNGNVLLMYALRRRFIPRLLGAIGILEDTASERFSCTVKGLKRYNLPDEIVKYHELHIGIDSHHGEQWLEHVLLPLMDKNDKDLMQEIAKGMLIRFNIALDYYEVIRQKISAFKSNMQTVNAI